MEAPGDAVPAPPNCPPAPCHPPTATLLPDAAAAVTVPTTMHTLSDRAPQYTSPTHIVLRLQHMMLYASTLPCLLLLLLGTPGLLLPPGLCMCETTRYLVLRSSPPFLPLHLLSCW
jgi:hypothetical protein